MQEEIQAEEELSLSEIFRALKAKIWVLLVTLIIGIAAGGGFGFLRYYNVHYYGADVTYFVSNSAISDENSTGQAAQTLTESALKNINGLLNTNYFQRLLMEGLPEAEGIEPDSKKEQNFFKLLSQSITYSYTVGESKITASVSVLNDPTFAAHLFDQVKAILPDFISTILSTTDKNVACTQLSYQLCRLLNPNQWVMEGIKYGALIGLAALVVACVAVVLAERADTRLHDYEKVAQKFNVPVLGVIPRISDIEHTHIQRNKTEGKK
ncbi:MAG TPA: hypothetical protein IAC57_00355 [Candidatus Scatosoma pullistercoris]|uniref:Capsular polysaccharide biosynthesis protein n=1 Tax=Candidatus Scatosoma pullistercoris TaxID=2840934 RepID=A0A9D1MDK3_9FIRM|nr:hypothetical protein [Candidatus Scatosoma pullistercoris]